MKKVFTTGQIAKICNVAPRTVSKWFDSGRLRGFRIPGSQDRRIPQEQLLKFMEDHGMPMDRIEDLAFQKILLIATDTDFAAQLSNQLRQSADFRVEMTSSAFEAGLVAANFQPHCIVIDTSIGGHNQACAIAQHCRKRTPQTILIFLAEDHASQNLYDRIFHDVFKKPFDAQLLAERISRFVSLTKEL